MPAASYARRFTARLAAAIWAGVGRCELRPLNWNDGGTSLVGTAAARRGCDGGRGAFQVSSNAPLDSGRGANVLRIGAALRGAGVWPGAGTARGAVMPRVVGSGSPIEPA